jgi:hypothetical protein
MGIVFAKTPKGQDEVATRSGGLSPRVRRVLIFVDGKRTVDDLRGMLQSDDLQHTLGMLEEEGYIEFFDISGIAPAAAAGQPCLRSPPSANCRPRRTHCACNRPAISWSTR